MENKLLFPKQFGFQINTLTKHAILELVRNTTKSFEKNEYVLGVLKKVFDTVNHEILLHKLKLWNKRYMFRMAQNLFFKSKSMHYL